MAVLALLVFAGVAFAAVVAMAKADRTVRRQLLIIVAVATAVSLLLVAPMLTGQQAPNITNSEPPTTISPAEACATGSLVDCSAACGGLAGDIQWRLDEAERRALEQQYERDCSQFGPPYNTSAPPP